MNLRKEGKNWKNVINSAIVVEKKKRQSIKANRIKKKNVRDKITLIGFKSLKVMLSLMHKITTFFHAELVL